MISKSSAIGAKPTTTTHSENAISKARFNKAVDQTVPGGLSDVLLLRNSERAFPGFRR